MAFKIYDLDDNTFLVDAADGGVVLFGYVCDVQFGTDEIDVNNLKLEMISTDSPIEENELLILQKEVLDRKSEIESMIIDYWIKERNKESNEI